MYPPQHLRDRIEKPYVKSAAELAYIVGVLAEELVYSRCGYDWENLTLEELLAAKGALQMAVDEFERRHIQPLLELGREAHGDIFSYPSWLEARVDPELNAGVTDQRLSATETVLEEAS